jgi:hypothetical protein
MASDTFENVRLVQDNVQEVGSVRRGHKRRWI